MRTAMMESAVKKTVLLILIPKAIPGFSTNVSRKKSPITDTDRKGWR